jgi:hypothetical protein
MNDKAVVKTEGNTPADMIRLAVSGGADLEKLEKLLSLQERYEANEARKAYHLAMSEFKANPPKIDKDRTVAYGNTKYNHASLGNVTEKINAELSKHGLSASWSTKQNGMILVTCKITHVQGHSEETTLGAAADSSGSKNSIQAIGSTITYLERYTLLALTGLATYEQDDDGVAAGVTEFIDDKQKSEILDRLSEVEADLPKFLVYLKIESLDVMPKAMYQQAIAAIEAKKARTIVKKGASK